MSGARINISLSKSTSEVDEGGNAWHQVTVQRGTKTVTVQAQFCIVNDTVPFALGDASDSDFAFVVDALTRKGDKKLIEMLKEVGRRPFVWRKQ